MTGMAVWPCSTSEIFWSGHTQGRFWKCCISQHHRLC